MNLVWSESRLQATAAAPQSSHIDQLNVKEEGLVYQTLILQDKVQCSSTLHVHKTVLAARLL